MEIHRLFIEGDGFHVPAVTLTPANPAGAAVIVSGYGGSKEEQLGLAWRVAETGLAACAIDLRGHGEHMLPFGVGALDDVDAAIRYCRSYGKVIVIGH
jgi:alpha-beta hydrolase superfamily lysophospholipase